MARRRFSTEVFPLLALGVTAGAAVVSSSPRLHRPKAPLVGVVSTTGFQHFKVSIYQKGFPVPVKNNTIQLRRKPFDLLMQTRKPCSLWINASYSDKLYNLARQGKRLFRIFTPFHIGADYDFNPKKQIFLSPGVPARFDQYWKIVHNNYYVKSKRDHRCDVARIYPGGCYCRRTIANLWQRRVKTPIERSRMSNLYMVFFKARCDKNNRCVELRREGLVLNFR